MRLTPVGAIVRGALAGAAGTVAMDAVWYQRYRRGGGTDDFARWDLSSGLDAWDAAPVPAQVGRRVVEGLLQRPLPPERARLVSNATHWGYGLAWGALFGLVAGSRQRRPSPRIGVPFGVAVWLTSNTALPATGLVPPIWKWDAKDLWQDISGHVVFGVVTATVFRALAGRAR